MNEYVRLSRTKLFEDMAAFYDQKGIEVWQDKLPFYVTTNMGFCYDYAKLMANMIYEGILNKQFDANQPFYLIELGAGFGRFAYHVICDLTQILKTFPIRIQFTYVISDCAKKNLVFLQKHPQMQPFIEQGLLDFAQFHSEKDNDIVLFNQKISLQTISQKGNPLVFMANYLFDSLKQDIFYIDKDKSIVEQLCLYQKNPDWLKNRKDYTQKQFTLKMKKNKDVNANTNTDDKKMSYYSDARINDVLITHAKEMQDCELLFPIGGLELMSSLSSLSGGRYILFTADKGCNTARSVQKCLSIDPSFHAGVCSFDVNYYALGEFAKNTGGDFWYDEHSVHFNLNVISVGFTLAPFVQTRLLYQNHSANMAYFLYSLMNTWTDSLQVHQLIELLDRVKWELDIFNDVRSRLAALWPNMLSYEKQWVLEELDRVSKKIFEVPVLPNSHLILGDFYTQIKAYDKAKPLLEKSLAIFEEHELAKNLLKKCCKELKLPFTLENVKENKIKIHAHIPKKQEQTIAEVFALSWKAVLSLGIILGVIILSKVG